MFQEPLIKLYVCISFRSEPEETLRQEKEKVLPSPLCNDIYIYIYKEECLTLKLFITYGVDLLELGQEEDFLRFLLLLLLLLLAAGRGGSPQDGVREGDRRRLDGAPQGRRHDARDLARIGEPAGELARLRAAGGRQGRVADVRA